VKSEERHDLATNELAKAVGGVVSQTRSYTTHLLVGLIVVVALCWVGYEWYKKSQLANVEQGMALMTALTSGGDRESPLTAAELLDIQIKELEKYIAAYPGSKTVNLAKFSRAGMLYDRGLVARADRAEVAEAEKFFSEAAKAFDELKGVEGDIGELAELGGACAAKALGRQDEAVSRLTALAAVTNSAAATLAQERLSVLRENVPLVIVPDKEPQKKTEDGGATDESPKADKAEGEPAAQEAPAEGAGTTAPAPETPAAKPQE